MPTSSKVRKMAEEIEECFLAPHAPSELLEFAIHRHIPCPQRNPWSVPPSAAFMDDAGWPHVRPLEEHMEEMSAHTRDVLRRHREPRVAGTKMVDDVVELDRIASHMMCEPEYCRQYGTRYRKYCVLYEQMCELTRALVDARKRWEETAEVLRMVEGELMWSVFAAVQSFSGFMGCGAAVWEREQLLPNVKKALQRARWSDVSEAEFDSVFDTKMWMKSCEREAYGKLEYEWAQEVASAASANRDTFRALCEQYCNDVLNAASPSEDTPSSNTTTTTTTTAKEKSHSTTDPRFAHLGPLIRELPSETFWQLFSRTQPWGYISRATQMQTQCVCKYGMRAMMHQALVGGSPSGVEPMAITARMLFPEPGVHGNAASVIWTSVMPPAEAVRLCPNEARVPKAAFRCGFLSCSHEALNAMARRMPPVAPSVRHVMRVMRRFVMANTSSTYAAQKRLDVLDTLASLRGKMHQLDRACTMYHYDYMGMRRSLAMVDASYVRVVRLVNDVATVVEAVCRGPKIMEREPRVARIDAPPIPTKRARKASGAHLAHSVTVQHNEGRDMLGRAFRDEIEPAIIRRTASLLNEETVGRICDPGDDTPVWRKLLSQSVEVAGWREMLTSPTAFALLDGATVRRVVHGIALQHCNLFASEGEHRLKWMEGLATDEWMKSTGCDRLNDEYDRLNTLVTEGEDDVDEASKQALKEVERKTKDVWQRTFSCAEGYLLGLLALSNELPMPDLDRPTHEAALMLLAVCLRGEHAQENVRFLRAMVQGIVGVNCGGRLQPIVTLDETLERIRRRLQREAPRLMGAPSVADRVKFVAHLRRVSSLLSRPGGVQNIKEGECTAEPLTVNGALTCVDIRSPERERCDAQDPRAKAYPCVDYVLSRYALEAILAFQHMAIEDSESSDSDGGVYSGGSSEGSESPQQVHVGDECHDYDEGVHCYTMAQYAFKRTFVGAMDTPPTPMLLSLRSAHGHSDGVYRTHEMEDPVVRVGDALAHKSITTKDGGPDTSDVYDTEHCAYLQEHSAPYACNTPYHVGGITNEVGDFALYDERGVCALVQDAESRIPYVPQDPSRQVQETYGARAMWYPSVKAFANVRRGDFILVRTTRSASPPYSEFHDDRRHAGLRCSEHPKWACIRDYRIWDHQDDHLIGQHEMFRHVCVVLAVYPAHHPWIPLQSLEPMDYRHGVLLVSRLFELPEKHHLSCEMLEQLTDGAVKIPEHKVCVRSMLGLALQSHTKRDTLTNTVKKLYNILYQAIHHNTHRFERASVSGAIVPAFNPFAAAAALARRTCDLGRCVYAKPPPSRRIHRGDDIPHDQPERRRPTNPQCKLHLSYLTTLFEAVVADPRPYHNYHCGTRVRDTTGHNMPLAATPQTMRIVVVCTSPDRLAMLLHGVRLPLLHNVDELRRITRNSHLDVTKCGLAHPGARIGYAYFGFHTIIPSSSGEGRHPHVHVTYDLGADVAEEPVGVHKQLEVRNARLRPHVGVGSKRTRDEESEVHPHDSDSGGHQPMTEETSVDCVRLDAIEYRTFSLRPGDVLLFYCGHTVKRKNMEMVVKVAEYLSSQLEPGKCAPQGYAQTAHKMVAAYANILAASHRMFHAVGIVDEVFTDAVLAVPTNGHEGSAVARARFSRRFVDQGTIEDAAPFRVDELCASYPNNTGIAYEQHVVSFAPGFLKAITAEGLSTVRLLADDVGIPGGGEEATQRTSLVVLDPHIRAVSAAVRNREVLHVSSGFQSAHEIVSVGANISLTDWWLEARESQRVRPLSPSSSSASSSTTSSPPPTSDEPVATVPSARYRVLVDSIVVAALSAELRSSSLASSEPMEWYYREPKLLPRDLGVCAVVAMHHHTLEGAIEALTDFAHPSHHQVLELIRNTSRPITRNNQGQVIPPILVNPDTRDVYVPRSTIRCPEGHDPAKFFTRVMKLLIERYRNDVLPRVTQYAPPSSLKQLVEPPSRRPHARSTATSAASTGSDLPARKRPTPPSPASATTTPPSSPPDTDPDAQRHHTLSEVEERLERIRQHHYALSCDPMSGNVSSTAPAVLWNTHNTSGAGDSVLHLHRRSRSEIIQGLPHTLHGPRADSYDRYKRALLYQTLGSDYDPYPSMNPAVPESVDADCETIVNAASDGSLRDVQDSHAHRSTYCRMYAKARRDHQRMLRELKSAALKLKSGFRGYRPDEPSRSETAVSQQSTHPTESPLQDMRAQWRKFNRNSTPFTRITRYTTPWERDANRDFATKPAIRMSQPRKTWS